MAKPLLKIQLWVFMSEIEINLMAEPSKFGATLNSGYFRFLSISHSGEALE